MGIFDKMVFRMKGKRVRYSARVPEVVLNECKKVSELTGLSVTEVIVQSVRLGLPLLLKRLHDVTNVNTSDDKSQ